jgi:hypothetical protein
MVLSGTAVANYALTGVATSTANITKVTLTLTANDQVINFGETPGYTYSWSGFISGESQLSVFGSSLPVSSLDKPLTQAGVYSIIPFIAAPLNYSMLFVNGTLYVNPSGAGARKIRTSLDCVTPLTGSPWAYEARFSYINDNITMVYVKDGPDNFLTSAGSFDGTLPPQLFNPGTGVFFVKFDGKKLTWTLTTNDSGHKSSVASLASSTSKKCTKDGFIVGPDGGPIDQDIRVYPNPVSDHVIVTLSNEPRKGDVIVYDIMGRASEVKMNWMGDMGLEIEMTGKPAGVYIIQVTNDGQSERFKILKQ